MDSALGLSHNGLCESKTSSVIFFLILECIPGIQIHNIWKHNCIISTTQRDDANSISKAKLKPLQLTVSRKIVKYFTAFRGTIERNTIIRDLNNSRMATLTQFAYLAE